MKKAELTVSALLVPVDFLVLLLSGFFAYRLRFDTSIAGLEPALYQISLEQFMAIVALVSIGWQVLLAWNGAYRARGTRRIVSEVKNIFTACSVGVLVIIVLFFLNRDLFSSRFIILAAYGLSVVLLSVVRVAILLIQRRLFRNGIGVHNVVLIGDGHVRDLIATEFKQNPNLGMHVKLKIDRFTQEAQEKILRYRERGVVDEVIHADPDISRQESEKIIEFCNEHHITFKYAATLFDAQATNVSVQPIAGVPVIEVKKTRLEGWGRIVKRLFDIVASLFLILLTSPIMIVAAVAIWWEDKGPVFFNRTDDGRKTTRIGQYGIPFYYFKFRSMKPGTDMQRYSDELQEKDTRKNSPLVKIKDDPRITKVGKLIRRFSIDELPEFFLVLKGDMSLVGPRPHRSEEVAKYSMLQKQVLGIKPGITGLPQISGRSDLEFDDEVRLDIFYMENWSLWLDVVIVLKTPLALIRRRDAL